MIVRMVAVGSIGTSAAGELDRGWPSSGPAVEQGGPVSTSGTADRAASTSPTGTPCRQQASSSDRPRLQHVSRPNRWSTLADSGAIWSSSSIVCTGEGHCSLDALCLSTVPALTPMRVVIWAADLEPRQFPMPDSPWQIRCQRATRWGERKWPVRGSRTREISRQPRFFPHAVWTPDLLTSSFFTRRCCPG